MLWWTSMYTFLCRREPSNQLCKIPRSVVAGSYRRTMVFSFVRAIWWSSRVAVQVHVRDLSELELLLLHILTSTCYYQFMDFSHSNCVYGGISLSFEFAISCRKMIMSIFLCAYLPSVYLLWGCICSYTCLLLNFTVPLLLKFKISLCILNASLFSATCFANGFFKSVACLFILLKMSFTEKRHFHFI